MKIELDEEELKLIRKFFYAIMNEPDLIVLEEVEEAPEEDVDEEMIRLFVKRAIEHVINDITFAERIMKEVLG